MPAADELLARVRQCATMFRFTLAAFETLGDHMHVLLNATGDEGITTLITSVMDETRNAIRQHGGPYRGFEWEESVHVTLLPPWHLPLLASFVRDQQRYHEDHTLEEELNEVFRPDGSADPIHDFPLNKQKLEKVH